MTDKKQENEATDGYPNPAPDNTDKEFIKEGLVVSKKKITDLPNLVEYHKWLPVWSDNTRFKNTGGIEYRAIAISLPQYFVHEPSDQWSVNSFVYGVELKGGPAEIFPADKVSWINS